MKEKTREEPKILAAAERQMQAWARSTEIADREHRMHAAHGPKTSKRTYLTLSRQTGAGAHAVATIVSEKLGWKVYDKNLLDLIAERFDVPRMMLDLVDETQPSWVYDVLGTWMDRAVVPHDKYVRYLRTVVRAVARDGEAIFIGRGAQYVLPHELGLRVHLAAPLKYRVQRLKEVEGISESEARRMITEKDRGRREFVERFYHRSLDDASQYDLVLNTERLGIEGAAEHVLSVMAD